MVRTETVAERVRMISLVDQIPGALWGAVVVACCLRDPDGALIFEGTAEEIDALGKKASGVVIRLSQKIAELNGMQPEAVEKKS
jgi:hypothetical protein